MAQQTDNKWWDQHACLCMSNKSIKREFHKLMIYVFFFFLSLEGIKSYLSYRINFFLYNKLNRINNLLVLYDTFSDITIETKYIWVTQVLHNIVGTTF
jgi:hypothetical protein